ncbi:hypothetical protein [Streptococcus suis]|uniref:hypothetical protein n=1 Tax=Streptococcus suis TaxID=1307 RepID=UPI0030103654
MNTKKLLKIKKSTIFLIEVIAYNVDFIGFQPIKTSSAKLKIQCPQGRAGSTPAAGIVYIGETLIYQRFFFCFVWRLGWF